MLRPNLAQDAPPTALTIGGVDYAINVDFRAWIGVIHLLRDLISAPETIEQAMHNVETIDQIETIVFGHRIPQPASDVLNAVIDFSAGYPAPPVGEGSESAAQTYSFEWDLNYIVIAIQTQFGIDLTYRREKPFHWWLFLLYFRALAGDHYILRLMEIRGYAGKDNDLKRQARRFALPREMTADEQATLDAFNALFDAPEGATPAETTSQAAE